MRKKKKPKVRRKPNYIKEWTPLPFNEIGLVFTKRYKLGVVCEECGANWDIEFYFDEDTPKTSYLCPANKCNLEKLGLDASGENTDNEIAEGQE